MNTVPGLGWDIVVTGLGMVSAAGTDAESTWKAVVAGRPAARTSGVLGGLAVDFACEADSLEPGSRLGADLVRRSDRFAQLALIAGAEALQMAGLDPAVWDGARAGVVLGTAFGGVATLEEQVLRQARGSAVSAVTVPSALANMAAGLFSLQWHARGPSLAVSTACASGTTAVGLAADLLRADVCDVVLAGGGEAPVTRLIAAAFARMNALSARCSRPAEASRPFDAERDGFVLGEGAATLVLERRADAAARGATALARVAGYGASADAHHITSPHPQAAGLEQATMAALAQAGATPADVDHVNAHATSTPMGDLAEARLLGRLVRDATVSAPKGVLGHTMGASGAIEAALTVLTIVHQIVPPTANLERMDPRIELDVVAGQARAQRIRLALSNSSGFGGQNAVLALAPA